MTSTEMLTQSAFSHRFKDAAGWQLVFTSQYMEAPIDRATLNARMSGNQNQSQNSSSSETKMVALASGSTIRLWAITDEGQRTDIGKFIYLVDP